MGTDDRKEEGEEEEKDEDEFDVDDFSESDGEWCSDNYQFETQPMRG